MASAITLTVGGQEYILSPLSANAIGRLGRWRKQQAGTELLQRDSASGYKLFSKEERWGVIQEMMNGSFQMDATSFDPEATAYLLWQAALPNHAGLEFETFADALKLGEFDQLEAIAARLFTGGPLEELEEANAEDPPTDAPGAES